MAIDNTNQIQIILENTKVLSLNKAQLFVTSNETGGIVHFVGTVRNQTKDKKVVKLDFEAYEPMAIKEMHKIAERALVQFDIQKIAIHHRTGSLEVGEIPVIIAVSSAHRKAAFAACEFAIDTLKETVPIWKKEYFEDGEVWVSATP
jgi:molybdopterin synthase catalytic subunit